jgi:hydrogenase nickel incorporation protein HypB
MCRTCGCDDADRRGRGHEHEQAHEHEHEHERQNGGETGRTISLERRLLARNDALAAENRAFCAARGVLALNLIGAPGAGKTALLERTIRDLLREIPVFVIEGDQATEADAERIRAAGAPAVQVNTGAGCHLDAAMVARALRALDPPRGALVLIENVGNLVCPALFDLGERAKVVVSSVTEGEDKPRKYPHVFRASAAVVLHKVDLLPHLAFDRVRFFEAAREANPAIRRFEVSSVSGEGLDAWYAWLFEARDRPAWSL